MDTTAHWWNPARALNRMALSPTLARRCLATLLDLALVSALQIGLSDVFGVVHASLNDTFGSVISGDGFSYSSSSVPTMASGALLVIVVAYFTLFETLFAATPGKALLRLRVVMLDGRRLNVSAVIARNIFRLVDTLPFFYLVGGIVAQSTLHEQRVGDIVAGTAVVSRSERDAGPPAVRRLRLFLLGAMLAALVGGSLAFQYYGRGPLVIQSWANMNNDFSPRATVRCGPLAAWPTPNSPQANTLRLQTPGHILQYAIGAPHWGDGVVTYPIRLQLWNSAQYGGSVSGEPQRLDMSQIDVGPSGDAYNGAITLRWEGPLTGWVMQSGQLDC